MFKEKTESGENKLYNILKAYASYDPKLGYIQAMNYLASALLLYIYNEEQCFWVLVFIMDDLQWREIFNLRSYGLKNLLTKLQQYLDERLPSLSQRLFGEDSYTNLEGALS